MDEEAEHDLQDVPKPKEIKAFLDQYVVGQERAKKMLSVAVRLTTTNASEDTKAAVQRTLKSKSKCCNAGLQAAGRPTWRTVGSLFECTLCKADATTLTEAGYVGEDVENILLRLVQAADYDIEKAERGLFTSMKSIKLHENPRTRL